MKPSRAARQCDSRRRRAERCHHYALYHRTVFLTWQNHRRHPVCTRLSELRNWMDLDTGSYLSVLDDVCPMGEETKQEEDMRSRKWERRPEARQRECRGWPQKEVTERQLQRASRAEGKTMSGSKRWNWNIKTWRDCPCGEPYWQLLDGVAGISKRYKENQADENTR